MTRLVWLATGAGIAAHLAGLSFGLPAALALTAVRTIVVLPRWRGRRMAVEVRAGFLGLMLVGLLDPFGVLLPMLLAGTLLRASIDYCMMARLLSLLPWHRPAGRLTWRRVFATFATPPTQGDLRAAIDERARRGPP